jgi:hypothetical protein
MSSPFVTASSTHRDLVRATEKLHAAGQSLPLKNITRTMLDTEPGGQARELICLALADLPEAA